MLSVECLLGPRIRIPSSLAAFQAWTFVQSSRHGKKAEADVVAIYATATKFGDVADPLENGRIAAGPAALHPWTRKELLDVKYFGIPEPLSPADYVHHVAETLRWLRNE